MWAVPKFQRIRRRLQFKTEVHRMSFDARLLCFALLVPAAACGGGDRASGSADGGSRDDTTPGEGFNPDLPRICNPVSPTNPGGLKAIKYLDSTETVYRDANWRVALEPETRVSSPSISGALPVESATYLDLADPSIEMAGFLVTRVAHADSAAGEVNLAQIALGSVATATTRASGSTITSLDGFDTVVSTNFELRTATATDATELRDRILPAILGRSDGDVSLPVPTWQSGSDNRFILTMQTIYRPAAGQTVHIGAIARAFDYDDRRRATGLHADDLANGSNVTLSFNGEARECEDEILDRQAKADVIWVVDESGSTNDDRERISSNATAFFGKAVDLGLDFRMAVTDMNDSSLGVFATREADGSAERWIQPNEPDAFAAAIEDPSGPAASDAASEHGLTQVRAALAAHLPRSDSDALKVRSDAKLAFVIMTDEKPNEIEEAGASREGNVEPTAAQAAQIQSLVQPYVDELNAEQAVVHLIAEPLPFAETCSGGGGEHAYGYYELVGATGGQVGSICQLELGATLDAMLDSIVGDASPLALDYVPISNSISVTRDGEVVPRSRQRGWDYRGASNAIVFYGMPLDPAHPADIVVGYRRWQDQLVD
jgi:hypothetical protein